MAMVIDWFSSSIKYLDSNFHRFCFFFFFFENEKQYPWFLISFDYYYRESNETKFDLYRIYKLKRVLFSNKAKVVRIIVMEELKNSYSDYFILIRVFDRYLLKK